MLSTELEHLLTKPEVPSHCPPVCVSVDRCQGFSRPPSLKYGPWPSIAGDMWKLIGNADSQARPQTFCLGVCIFTDVEGVKEGTEWLWGGMATWELLLPWPATASVPVARTLLVSPFQPGYNRKQGPQHHLCQNLSFYFIKNLMLSRIENIL